MRRQESAVVWFAPSADSSKEASQTMSESAINHQRDGEVVSPVPPQTNQTAHASGQRGGIAATAVMVADDSQTPAARTLVLPPREALSCGCISQATLRQIEGPNLSDGHPEAAVAHALDVRPPRAVANDSRAETFDGSDVGVDTVTAKTISKERAEHGRKRRQQRPRDDVRRREVRHTTLATHRVLDVLKEAQNEIEVTRREKKSHHPRSNFGRFSYNDPDDDTEEDDTPLQGVCEALASGSSVVDRGNRPRHAYAPVIVVQDGFKRS